jgi:diguanylate cyclase (GGDEF)-like protein/PAS domain S-box-containing protein
MRIPVINRSDSLRDDNLRPVEETGAAPALDDRLAIADLGHRLIDDDRSAERLLLRSLINSVPDYLFIKDTEGHFVVANRPVAEDLGLTVADLIGKTDFDIHRRDLASKFFADEQRVISSGKPSIDIEEFVVTKSGQRKWLATSKLPLRNRQGDIIGIVGVCRNITERKHVEGALAESESRWSFALEGAGQGVWDHDLRRKTAYFSPMWRKMRGIAPDEPIDPSRSAWLARVHPDDRQRIAEEADRQNAGDLKQNSFEYRERHRDGHWMWILSRGRPVEWMPDGSVARIIGTDTDITTIKEAEAHAAEEKAETYRRHLAALEKAHEATEVAHKLAQSMARHDALTGLPNRRVFAETLNTAVARAERGSARSAVMIVDLDRFKPVNDLYGHAAGDDVLREIAVRLGNLARKIDTVARLGGDEFGFILDCVAPEDPTTAASALAERIIASVGQPIPVENRLVEVGASIGIGICPIDGTDPETLLRAADMAMYRAKEEGRGSYRFFNQDMETALRERVALEEDVRRAVQEHDIQPHYQPLIELAENRLVGFEILARWHHPTRGNVEPDTFIPIVEKLGLIGELTYDLLRRACLDARSWPPTITIAINISPLHLADPVLPVKLLAILSETDFPPTRLEIEVTETALIANVDAARTALAALREIGIKVSLDDFGTGYSNLYNLRELHFDKIKIDRSFVLSMQDNPGSAKIVRSVIDLAKSLGLPTIAEGIEHRDVMQQIVQSGGEFGQGFYFSKAMPAAEAKRFAQDGVNNPGTLKKSA